MGALRIRGVANELTDARDALRNADQDVRAGRLVAARGGLVRAGGLVARANSTLHQSPELSLLQFVPVARQNIEALRRSVGLALALTTGGRGVLDAAEPLQGADG